MPIYPNKVTYKGYFYDNKVVNGVNDRVYGAKDIRKPYDVVFTDGIRPDADGTAGNELKVTALGGLMISIAKGHAKLGGAPFENEEPYNIDLDIGSGAERYDWVIIQSDDSESARKPTIYIRSETRIPTVADLIRPVDGKGDIYEICIAYVRIPANAQSITDENITDTREDNLLCGLMSGVGATIVRTYRNTYFTSSANEKTIPIGISQFDKDKDELIVAVEGRVFALRTDYAVTSNTHILLSIGLPVIGTKIEFTVHKNVNASTSSNNNVSADIPSEVGQLQVDVANLQKITEHHYYCNGSTDNILLGDMVRNALVGSGYASTKIVVHGTLVAGAPVLGDGSTSNPYCWFNFYASTPTRRVIIDFSDCTQIVTPITGGYNVVFYGNYFHIIGANYIVNSTTTTTEIRVFSAPNNTILCDNCRFWITGYKYSIIALNGTFRNCRGSVTNSIANTYCFNPQGEGMLRLEGGEYYAYTASTSGQSAILRQSNSDSCSILYGVSAPTIARSGYYQTNSILQDGGYVNCTDLITKLPMSVLTGQSNIRGTIPFDKPSII